METINSAFLKLKQVQGAENHVLFDTGETYSGSVVYSKLTGESASTATFTSFGPWQQGYKVVGPNTVVCVEFADGSTLMVLDGKFYAKPVSSLPQSPIKLVVQGRLPSSESGTQTYNLGDVVMAYTLLSDSGVPYAIDDFVIAICTGANSSSSSGTLIVTYTWMEVAHFPATTSEQSSLSS